jgi:hypothetical protein
VTSAFFILTGIPFAIGVLRDAIVRSACAVAPPEALARARALNHKKAHYLLVVCSLAIGFSSTIAAAGFAFCAGAERSYPLIASAAASAVCWIFITYSYVGLSERKIAPIDAKTHAMHAVFDITVFNVQSVALGTALPALFAGGATVAAKLASTLAVVGFVCAVTINAIEFLFSSEAAAEQDANNV